MNLEDILPASAEARAALLQRILGRCIEDGDCLRWQAALNGDGHPMMKVGDRTVPVRRVVYHLVRGPLQPGLRAAMTCECLDCIAGAHMQALTHAQLMRLRARQGRLHSALRAAKSARRGRAASRWSDADIEAFRASTGTLEQRARQFGMSLSYAHQLSTGQWRRPLASPWAGMGQRRA